MGSEPKPADLSPVGNHDDDAREDSSKNLDTITEVQDDGRVNINITEADAEQFASQIRENRAAVQQNDAELVTPSESSSGLLDDQSSHAPLPLNVVIHVIGSRGDVQPFVALGKVLKDRYGHRVRLATHGTFKKFVEENGLEFFEIGGDPAELMAFMVKNPRLIPGIESIRDGDVGKRRKSMVEIIDGCWRSCADNLDVGENESAEDFKPFVANAIIANPPSFAHVHCAEKLGIPLHLMFTMPWSPTVAFPHPLANLKSANTDGGAANEMSYSVVDMMTWEGLGHITNNFRQSIGLPSLARTSATTMVHRLRIPHTYCWSPALIPKPKDWGDHIDISGFYFLSLGSSYQPDPDLKEFLDAGPPPVYIGFGSIVVEDPNGLTKLIFEAVQKTGQRALVSKGWGGLGGSDLAKPDGVFMLGNCPHDWLFQHVSCVVHHGGAGTTAAGVALGRPTVIVPFFGDQPFWGAMISRAGAGPDPIPFKALTAEKLASGILEAIKPETLERAKILGERIREEKGCEEGAASFQKHLNTDRLRCVLCPERPAVWRVHAKDKKKPDVSKIRLSTFAASTLCAKGVLSFEQLELYHPCNYGTKTNTVTSVVNGPNPVLGAMGSVASYVVRWPVEVGKAWAGLVTEPIKGAKEDSWRGLGKGIGRGVGHFLFPGRALAGASIVTARGVYKGIKKRLGSDNTLAFVLATHVSQGWQEVKDSTEEEREQVLSQWKRICLLVGDVS